MKKKTFVVYTGIIALYFLWGGSAYISQMYRLQDYLLPEQVDAIAMLWNYISQVIGILFYSILLWKYPGFMSKRIIYAGGLIFSAVSVVVMLTSRQPGIIILSGLIMNLLLGALAGHHLAMLAYFVPQNYRGRAFGFAYALGSIGTYLISLFSGGTLLSSSNVTILYLLLIAAHIALIYMAQDIPAPDKNTASKIGAIHGKWLFLVVFSVFLIMSLLNAIGSNYQSGVLIKANVTLESTRLFYGAGLIIAGIIADRNRRYIAICCLASLVYPFIGALLYGLPSMVFIAWGLSYLILSFYSVYRVVAFVDIAGKSPNILPMAGIGLCIGRIGEAASTLINDAHLQDPLFRTLLISALFVPLIFLFINLYQKFYIIKVSPAKDMEKLYREFSNTYSLSNRETDVLRQLVQGNSNSEISGALYISESTVKFHMRNILRKTMCSNRTEVLNIFHKIESRVG